jgi:hypothetical protein
MPASPPDPDSQPIPPEDEAAATEHLTHLPRMSPTAGVAATEYVAINNGAIAALLLGMASVLALMNITLGVLAILGVVIALISLRQINSSNGTQTGAGLALAGLFFAVAIGSYVGSSTFIQDYARREDKQAIAALCEKFGKALSERRYDDAYSMFSMRFRSQVSRVDFVSKMRGEQDMLDRGAALGQIGPIVEVTWNGLIAFNADYDAGTFVADSGIELHYKNTPSTNPLPAVFRKVGDTWYFETITRWVFDTKQLM